MKHLIFLFSLLTSICALSFTKKDSTKIFYANRTYKIPIIDGIIEDIWFNTNCITGFTQTNPYFGQNPLYDTKVYILYDDYAIYVAAFLKDNYPDSILKQLGNRDFYNLNADYFSIAFDTYNKQQDAFWFGVYSSGVQFDRRTQDNSYNAVWKSSTAIVDSGWVVEMQIPYSALRLPKTNTQEWGLQIVRYIRRNREESKIAPEPREANNAMLYWAQLKGIENIKVPLRLSLSPYLTSGFQIESSKSSSKLISGGTDLKYGINESFTIDVTLLPDFSQIQSDNKYKNLTAYETIYEEQRPFFKESVELFNKGNIFYSRRIGKTPQLFYKIGSLTDTNETIKKNPTQVQLINAFKISGRNKNGLALGILNAITSNTYAKIEDNEGKQRKILTEPWANYNVFVLDKAFKRGNNIYFTNTNYFTNKTENSNVCASGLSITDKHNIWRLNIMSVTSIFYFPYTTTEVKQNQGYNSSLSVDKILGKLKYGYSTAIMDKNFNANKVGITLYNNYFNNNIYIKYNEFEPRRNLLNYNTQFQISQQYHFSTMNIFKSNISLSSGITTKKYTSYWADISYDLYDGYDYYEPRMKNFYFRTGQNWNSNFGISTDYRKPFAIDVSVNYNYNFKFKTNNIYIHISPLGRITNHFSYRYKLEYNEIKNQIGFASIDELLLKPIFGKRNVTSITNSITANYFFKNDLSLSLKFRHYFSQGKYKDFYHLLENGSLSDSILTTLNQTMYNFNFNSLNVDLIFSWQFAPGSNLLLIWKNEIFNEGNLVYSNFFDNLSALDEYPQTNTFLIKLFYFLDYEYFFRNKRK